VDHGVARRPRVKHQVREIDELVACRMVLVLASQ
jgi:hypothetical protein